MNSSLRYFALLAGILPVVTGCVGVNPSAQSVLGESVIQLAGEPAPQPSSTGGASANVVLDLQAELKVSEQTGDGSQVKLEEVRVGRANTMLVIQDATGNILGTLLLSPGSEPIAIPLNSRVTSSGLLVATLFLDDGDRQFDANTDALLIDDDGALMRVFFNYLLGSGNSTTEPSPTNQTPASSDSESDQSEDDNPSEDDSSEDSSNSSEDR